MASSRAVEERGDRTPTLAVIDSGIDSSHPALRGRVVRTWSAPDLSASGTSHGTQIAGLVAGHPEGEFPGGVLRRAQLFDVRVLDEAGQASPDLVAHAIDWAVVSRADYIVTSFGTERDDPALREAVVRAVDAGVVVVAAAGNGFGSFDFYPAAYPGVITITAHDGEGARLPLANGKAADFAAPGKDLLAPTSAARYERVSGTSAATAVAAGVIAACWDPEVLPDYTVAGGRSWPAATVAFPGNDVPALDCQPHQE